MSFKRRRRTRKISLETLEARRVLAGTLLISEFVAQNNTGLTDDDGEFTDWIEIYNPTIQPVGLEGWHLTDDATELDKWTFPDIDLAAGEFLVVHASNKDRIDPAFPLHTNFKLSGGGEYLALTDAGQTIVHDYAPSFPDQQDDVAYGLSFSETTFVGEATPFDFQVPSSNADGTDWTLPSYTVIENDWTDGLGAVGFGNSFAGFLVNYIDINGGTDGAVTTTTEATAILDGDFADGVYILEDNITALYSEIDFAGGGGTFGIDNTYPDGEVANASHITARATTEVTIPIGDWTIGFGRDDGGYLRLDGVNFSGESNTSGDTSPGDDELRFEGGGAHAWTSGQFSVVGSPLTTTLDAIFFEAAGGDSWELAIRQGHGDNVFVSGGALLSNGALGWQLETPPALTDDYLPVAFDVGAEMQGVNTTAYARYPFAVDDASAFDSLDLQVQYSDGFIAYLNGTEIGRANAPVVADWQSVATDTRTIEQTYSITEIDLTSALNLLVDGPGNVLAIHLMNDDDSEDALFFNVDLGSDGIIDESPRFLATPTPLANNEGDFFGYLPEVAVTFESGYYDNSFTTELSSAQPGVLIRYTLDSSVPTETNGMDYAVPIVVDSTTTLRATSFAAGFRDEAIATRTYIFIDDVLTQDGAGLPTTWGVFVNNTGSVNPGDPVPANYDVSADVVNNPLYTNTIRDDLRSLPTISLVLPTDDVFGAERGIYANSLASGVDWERATSFEYFNADGELEVRADAGLRVHGGWGRRPSQTNKHSFRLLFKGEYGPSKLEYPIFGDDATDRFDTLVLRAGFNDSWGGSGNSNSTYAQDRWAAETQLEMGHVATHGNYAHVYINGLYWGMYNPVERPNASFGASYFGGNKDEYDAYVTGKNIDGNSTAWNEMFALVRSGNFEYEEVTDILDTTAFIDYLIINQYGGNWDWPHNNWYATHRRGEGGKWYFHTWDAEGIFRNVNDDRTNNFGNNGPGELYQHLRNSPDFQREFGDRIQKHFFGDGLLTPAKAVERFDRIVAQYDRGIVGESARWGDGRWNQANPDRTRDANWLPRLNSLRNGYFPQRTSIVLQQYRNAGLYPSIDAPQIEVNGVPSNGGNITSNDTILAIPSLGASHTSINGQDPRLDNDEINPSNIDHELGISFIGPIQVGNYLVPSGAVGEVGWQDTNFNDANWNPLQGGFGFDTGPFDLEPGFEVHAIDLAGGVIDNVVEATQVLDGNLNGFVIDAELTTRSAYLNLGSVGVINTPPNLDFPAVNDGLQYVMRASADVTIPAGSWSLLIGSHDGFHLTIPGVVFNLRSGDNLVNFPQPIGDDELVYNGTRSHSSTLGRFLLTEPLETTIQLDYFNQTGSPSLEFMIAAGAVRTIIEDGADGWALNSTPSNVDFDPLIETDVQNELFDIQASAYLRYPFQATNVAGISRLELDVQYDDGFVAYLNGNEVARRNAPNILGFDSTATASQLDGNATVAETIALDQSLLADGDNVLAVHAMNRAADDADLLFIPTLTANAPINLQDSAVVRSRALLDGEWSAMSEALFLLNEPAAAGDLAVRELNYHPSAPTTAELAQMPGITSSDFEFVEIVNSGNRRVDLPGVTFVDGIEFTFGNDNTIALGPDEVTLLVRDRDAFELRYGDEIEIGGVFSGQLDDTGESLVANDSLGVEILSFTYNDNGSWPGRADGSGSTLQITDPSLDPNAPDSWESSTAYNGSPGDVDIVAPAIVINEVLTHTDLPQVDFVELVNNSNASIDVSGWFISDSNNYEKFAIPADTNIAPGEYLVFDESDFNSTGGVSPNDFAFSSHGDDAWLLAANESGIQAFVDHVDFGAARNGESFGRWPNATGNLYPMVSVTEAGFNSGPRVGPVVITEVMYHPPANAPVDADDLEFVEIFNTTALPMSMTNWEITGGIDYAFDDNFTLDPGVPIVVLSFNPDNLDNAARVTAFRDYYNIGAEVLLLGGWSGKLDNGGETIRLMRPDAASPQDPTFLPLLIEDIVRYDDEGDWPTTPDGSGDSLTRDQLLAWSDTPQNWLGATPTPGLVDTTDAPPTVVDFDWNVDKLDPPDLPQGAQPANWNDQHSLLANLQVRFSEPVAVSLNNFVLTNLGVNAPAEVDEIIDISNAILTSSSDIVRIDLGNVTLPDGVLRLTVLESVVDLAGQSLDGDDDGNSGGDFEFNGSDVNQFYKLVADWNGDRGVSVFDFTTFSYWFGQGVQSAGGPAPSYVDNSGDGGISVFDFTGFSTNFGRGITFPVGFAAGGFIAPVESGNGFRNGNETGNVNEANELAEQPVLVREFGEFRANMRPGELKPDSPVELALLERNEAMEEMLEDVLDRIAGEIAVQWER
jgi:hypothetical protein